MVKSRFGGRWRAAISNRSKPSLVRGELHLDIQPRARHAGSQLWRRRGEAEAHLVCLVRMVRADYRSARRVGGAERDRRRGGRRHDEGPADQKVLVQTHVSCLLLWMVLSSHKDTAWAPIFPVAANISISVAGRRSPRAARARVRGSGGMSRAERSPRECERSASVPNSSRARCGSLGVRHRTGARGRALRVTVVRPVPMRRRQHDEAGPRELAELAALADGSLAPERRAALEARVAASPELADRLAEQQRAVALARGAAAGVEAPAALRARIALHGGRSPTTPRRLVAVGSALPSCWPSPIGLARAPARARPPSASTPPSHPPSSCPAPAARRRSPRQPRAGGSSSTPRGCRAARARSSTRRGCAIPPACSCRSGRSTRAGRSRCGRACRRRSIRA